ncbi:MAG: hypothetical protein Kow0059_03060 [Candidatus Sumerlaeia bacterium]
MTVGLKPHPPVREDENERPAPANLDEPRPSSAGHGRFIPRRTRRRVFLAGLVIIALILAAIVLTALQIKERMAAAAAAKAAALPPPAEVARVAVLELKGVPFADTIQLPGTLIPWRSVKVSSETNGPVVKKGVEEGQRVEAGQVIFEIDTDTLQTELELARTRLTLAEKQLDRTRELFAQGFASREKLDEDENAVEQEQANVRLKQLRLEKATIQAPLAGVINHTYVEAGDYVREGTPLCEIIQTDRLKMIVGVPEKDVVYLREGQRAPVQVDALTARGAAPLQGTIHKIIPAADDVTHTFSVEVAVDEPGELARPGMIGRVELTRRTLDNAILIPIFSVMRHSQGYAVFVERDGKAQRRFVQIGRFLPQGLQIESGLAPGDRLIVRGQRDLVDGEPVSVVKQIGSEVYDLAARMSGTLNVEDIERALDEFLSLPSDATPPVSSDEASGVN